MKRIIYYSVIALLFLVLGCAGRQSSAQKSKKVTDTSLQEDQKTAQKTVQKKDSMGSKKVTEKDQGSSKSVSKGWKYTAPATTSPCFNSGLIKPYFIYTSTGDSIDVSRLPLGSSIESLNDSHESSYSLQRTVEEQSKKISDLKQDLKEERSKKAKDKIVEVEKLKEVERQTIQWYLVGAALVLGTFLPNIFKWAATLIKKSIKPI